MDLPAIETTDLTKTYNKGKVKALDGVSLQIMPGEVFGLIGPNGAGKSTLVGLLLGLLRATSGEIRMFGRSPFDVGIRRMTGYLPERPEFDSWMTIQQFLRYHHMLAHKSDKNIGADIERAMQRVGLPSEMLKRPILKLSRGLLQRVGLAQLLIGDPKLCFMDEPDSGMDPVGTQLVRQIIEELKAQGATVLVNSHHLDQVGKTCDRVAFIARGKIRSVHVLTEGALLGNRKTMRLTFDAGVNGHAADILAQAANEVGFELVECAERFARVSLPEHASPSALIKVLVRLELPIEEAIVERRKLEELFTEDFSQETVPK